MTAQGVEVAAPNGNQGRTNGEPCISPMDSVLTPAEVQAVLRRLFPKVPRLTNGEFAIVQRSKKKSGETPGRSEFAFATSD